MSNTKETKISKELVVKQETSAIGPELALRPGGNPSSRTTLISNQTANRGVSLPDANTTLVGTDTIDTLTNKNISGSANVITNVGNSSLLSGIDATKIGNGDVDNTELSHLNGVTSNVQTQLNTLTSATSDIVTSSNTKTLTNKTMSGSNNTFTNIPNSALSSGIDAAKISSGLVTNTVFDRLNGVTSNIQTQLNSKLDSSNVNIVYKDDTQTLTNKTLSDGTIYDSSAINFSLKGTTGSDKRLKFNADNITDFTTRTMTFPNADSVILSTDASQVVTNKDIDGGTASNTNRIVIPKNTLTNLQGLTRKQGAIVFDTTSLKPYYDDGTNLRVIGSGSGTGGNLLSNGDAETSTTGWVTGSFPYDAGLFTPPRGTFTPSTPPASWVFGTTTALPISGTNSFQINKVGAVATQGWAVTQTITLDPIYRGKVMKMRLHHYIIDGSNQYSKTLSSFIMYIGEYNGSTWSYKQPSTFKLDGVDASGSGRVTTTEASFQTNIDTTQLMYIIYDTDFNTAVTYRMVFEAELLAQDNMYASPFTDEKSYTPTVQGLGTLAANNVNWSQMGDKLYLRGRVTIGTTTAVEARIYLPNTSMIVDDVKITAIQIVGDVTRNTATNAGNGGDWYLLAEPGVNYLTVGILNPGSGGLAKQNGTSFSTGDIVSFNAIVPIKGWSSGLLTSTDAGTRPCFAMYRLASAALTANQPINYATLVVDSHGAVTTGASWKFIAPFADVYEVTAQGASGTTNTAYSVYKNGTLFSEIAYTIGATATNHCANGSVLVPMNAGDYVDVRSVNSLTSTATSVSGSTVSTANYVFIRNVRAQQVIAASENISCSVYLNANAAVAANGIIIFNSTEYDSHGAFNLSTGTFTAPQAAEYELTSYISNTTSSNMTVQIWKNGANYKPLTIVTNSGYGQGTARIKLLAGETITIRSSTAVSYSGSASLSAGPCALQITKIGNF